MGMDRLFIGVEIGATKIQAALGNASGDILHTVHGRVELADGAAGILRWMKENIPGVASMAPRFGGKAAAIGIGFGGTVESATGTSLMSVQVDGWKNFNIKKWFEEAFALPAVVLNDTVAGGYGEFVRGSGVGSRSFFYTNIGSGIGGVFIFGGVYYDGIGCGAAYFGHTHIPDLTRASAGPGGFTTVEKVCSGFAIEGRLRAPGYVPEGSGLARLCGGDASKISCAMLAEAARAGDAFALSEIDMIAKSYAIGLSNVITLVSPDRVSIGGGVAKMGGLLFGPVRRYTDELVFSSSKGKYDIIACKHGDGAVPIGAMLFAKKELDL